MANYTSFSKSTLKDKPRCNGKAFNRIIQVWLENTDFAVRFLPCCLPGVLCILLRHGR
jgi:hypothetical protein